MRMWMSDVRKVEPRTDTRPALSGAQFSDAFSITVDENLDARHAAERMMAGKSWWIDALLVVRNIIVAPFGLKDGKHKDASLDVIGIFPVVSETPERLVAGFDDKHKSANRGWYLDQGEVVLVDPTPGVDAQGPGNKHGQRPKYNP